MLERVTVDVQGESEQVAVTLQWAGGFRSAHNVIRPVGRYTQLSTYPVLLSRIDALREVGLSFAQIAVALNRDGFAPPKRTQRFTGGCDPFSRNLECSKGMRDEGSLNL